MSYEQNNLQDDSAGSMKIYYNPAPVTYILKKKEREKKIKNLQESQHYIK